MISNYFLLLYKMIPTWDGSFLGTINRKQIKIVIKDDILPLKLINFDDVEIWCYIKKSDDNFICFYDEIKILFGLQKQGTNSIKIGKSNYIISKYTDMKKIKRNKFKKYKDEISRILVYRKIMNVSALLNDIYILCNKTILDLSITKHITKFKIRMYYIDLFFDEYLKFEKILFFKMLKGKYKETSEYIDIIDKNIIKVSKHIENKGIDEDIVTQNILYHLNRIDNYI